MLLLYSSYFTMTSKNPNIWDRVVAVSTALGVLVTLLAVAVSIYLMRLQIIELRDEAKIQRLVEESRRFDEPPLLTSVQALAEKRMDPTHKMLRPLDKDNPPTEMWDVLNECDHLGLLTKRGYLDVSDVWSEMAYWLFDIYADAQPVIEADRKDYPASMVNCSWLIDQIRPIEVRDDAGAQANPTQSDIYDFYDDVLDSKPGGLTTRRHTK
jgi:hypothetical protein